MGLVQLRLVQVGVVQMGLVQLGVVQLSESKMDLWERYVDALRIKLSYHYELCFVERQNGRLFGETIKVLDTDVNDQVCLAPSIPA